MATLIDKFLLDPYEFIEKEDIKIIIKLAKYASKKYFNGEAIMSDNEFDLLVDVIKKRDPKNAFLKEVGASIMTKQKVDLPFYMGSMNKFKPDNISELEKWKKKYPGPYYISDKLDGVSALLEIDRDSNTIRLFTRGDGKQGTDITPLIKYLNLDHVITKIKGNYVVIRGELIISKDNFKKYEEEMANARNMVSGIVNSKKIIPSRIKDVDFVAYEIIEPWMSIKDQYLVIHKNGFKVVYNHILKDFTVDKLSNLLKERKLNSPYEIDGIIVSYGSPVERNIESNPDYAFAFKETVEDSTALVKVIEVDWNETKDGYLKPRLILEPTKLSGVVIKHVTAFNAKYIKDNKIGPATIIKLVRSGDVIPHILEVVKSSKQPQMPDGNWDWSPSGVDIIVKTKSMDGKIRELTFFVQKLNIKFLNESLVKRLIDKGIDSMLKFITIKKTDLEGIEGFQDKMITKIYNSITESINKMTLLDLMVASNLLGRGLGEKKLKKILDSYPDIIHDYINGNDIYEMIIKLEGFDDITSTLFSDNIIAFVEFLHTLPNNIQKKLMHIEKKEKGTKFKDIKIVFSGFRNKEWEKIIEDEGGNISSTVSKNTDILVAKKEDIDSGDTTKIQKAKQLNVTIMTPEEFLKKFKM